MALSLHDKLNTYYVNRDMVSGLDALLRNAKETNTAIDISGMRFVPRTAALLLNYFLDGVQIEGASPKMQEFLDENERRHKIEVNPEWPTITLPETNAAVGSAILSLEDGADYVADGTMAACRPYLAYLGLIQMFKPKVNVYMDTIAADLMMFLSPILSAKKSPINEYYCVRDHAVIVKQIIDNEYVDMDHYGKVDKDSFFTRFYPVTTELGKVKKRSAWSDESRVLINIVAEYYTKIRRTTLYEYLQGGDN